MDINFRVSIVHSCENCLCITSIIVNQTIRNKELIDLLIFEVLSHLLLLLVIFFIDEIETVEEASVKVFIRLCEGISRLQLSNFNKVFWILKVENPTACTITESHIVARGLHILSSFLNLRETPPLVVRIRNEFEIFRFRWHHFAYVPFVEFVRLSDFVHLDHRVKV